MISYFVAHIAADRSEALHHGVLQRHEGQCDKML